MKSKQISLVAITGSTVLILSAILPWRGFEPVGHWERIGWLPFVSRPISLFDVIGNLVLFVPLGASIALHARRRALLRTGVATFACSLLGEWAQIYSRNRYPTTQDILLNVTGAVLAACGAEYLRRRRRAPAGATEVSGESEAGTRIGAVTYGSPASSSAFINGRGEAHVD